MTLRIIPAFMSGSPNSRVDELQANIAARLRSVCYDWPADRFDAMVRNLAFITVKYEKQVISYSRKRLQTE